MSIPRLQLAHITKRYPAVVANNDVSLTVQPGEAHAVLGENGAGKSTLMKIIYGSVKPDAGQVLWDGQPVQIRSPHEARALGISMVFQHFSLFDTLTVAENVWLGLEKSLTLAQVTDSIVAKAGEYGLDIDPARPVHTLSVGEMQRVEIVRALLTQPKLLILDEPTSVLTPQAVDKLFIVLKKLASEGCSILYISHKLHEIRELCTACTVLRGGEVTGVCNPQEESNASLSRLMIGAEPPELEHHDRQPGDLVLKVQDLRLARADQFGVDLDGISLEVRAGEVVGIAGVSGNGQQELLYALSGEDARAQPAMIQVAGKDVGRFGPAHRRHLGVHFVPEERLGRGAVPTLDLAHNLMLTRTEAIHQSGWIDMKALEAQARGIISRFGVKAGGPQAPARSLSGGNLQKFIVGREIDANPRLLILSQPTWGVDVGASAQIRGEILGLRDAGCAVLVVSEELEELFEISDRLHVIAKGRLSPSIDRARASVSLIGEWMSGLWGESPAGPEGSASAGTGPGGQGGPEFVASTSVPPGRVRDELGLAPVPPAPVRDDLGPAPVPAGLVRDERSPTPVPLVPVRAELGPAPVPSVPAPVSSSPVRAELVEASVGKQTGTSTGSVRTEEGSSTGSVQTQTGTSTGSVRTEEGSSTGSVQTGTGPSTGSVRTEDGSSTGPARTDPRQAGGDRKDHA